MKSTHSPTAWHILKAHGMQAGRPESGEAFGLGSLAWCWHFVKALCITSKGLLLDQKQQLLSCSRILFLPSLLVARRGHINIIFSGNLFMAFLFPAHRERENSFTWHTFPPSYLIHTVSSLICLAIHIYIYIYEYIYVYVC